ncbi:hypothetical protein [Iodidimonas gelatinilytica]|nr:hypothetical protein [Iodidimonas gelatinilytica]
MREYASRLVFSFFVFLMAGCASPAQKQNMIVDQSALVKEAENSRFSQSLMITSVSGGEETNPLWTSEIDSDAFHGALTDSLKHSGLIAETPEQAKYELRAILAKVKQPSIGFNYTVTSDISYLITEKSSGNLIFEEEISTPYTASLGESIYGVKRLRLANEGSIRENIKTFIARILSTE